MTNFFSQCYPAFTCWLISSKPHVFHTQRLEWHSGATLGPYMSKSSPRFNCMNLYHGLFYHGSILIFFFYMTHKMTSVSVLKRSLLFWSNHLTWRFQTNWNVWSVKIYLCFTIYWDDECWNPKNDLFHKDMNTLKTMKFKWFYSLIQNFLFFLAMTWHGMHPAENNCFTFDAALMPPWLSSHAVWKTVETKRAYLGNDFASSQVGKLSATFHKMCKIVITHLESASLIA